MELASMLAGEPFTDKPRSVSPVIRGLLRVWNDRLDDQARQGLYRFAADVVGTCAGREIARHRVRVCLEAARLPLRGPMGWFRTLVASHAGSRAAMRLMSLPPSRRHERLTSLVDDLIALSRGSGSSATAMTELFGEEPRRDAVKQ
jgi:hypothetical protein